MVLTLLRGLYLSSVSRAVTRFQAYRGVNNIFLQTQLLIPSPLYREGGGYIGRNNDWKQPVTGLTGLDCFYLPCRKI